MDDLEQALLASKIVSYAQGYMLMREAAHEYGWNLNYGGIALMWRGGCIIRSVFLGEIKKAFDDEPQLNNLLLANYFKNAVEKSQVAWRRVVAKSVELGIPLPSMSAALSFYDGYRSARLPANLLQAQRYVFLVLIPMNGWTSPEGNSSTPIGWGERIRSFRNSDRPGLTAWFFLPRPVPLAGVDFKKEKKFL